MPEKPPKGIEVRGRALYVRVKIPGRGWRWTHSGFKVGEEAEALRFRRQTQELLDAHGAAGLVTGKSSLAEYFERWILERKKLVKSWQDDESRFRTWVEPAIGAVTLAAVRARHVNEVVQALRGAKKAPKTVRNVYGVLQSLFRDAEIAGLVDRTPCILSRHQLGKIEDGRREWRATALYAREECLALTTDPRVPRDRQVLYALLYMGMLRHGEAAGLRWRHWTTGLKPLGRLVVATSYDAGETKTIGERWMPVHRTLAAALADWKLAGWAALIGRAPGPDDLIVPHGKPTNRGPRVVQGGMRSDHDTYKRLRLDVDALGLRRRRVHDLRRSGITHAREGGALPDKLKLATHGAGRNVMELYTSMGWETLCSQVAALKVSRVTPVSPSAATNGDHE